jgi:predicted restriction endonuclease
MPLKFLFNVLDKQKGISLHEFEVLVDGNTLRVGGNTSYWRTDLINSGLFKEKLGRLIYTGKYVSFVKEIKNFNPNPLLTDDDWRAIRENPIIEISPFKDSVRKIFEGLAQEQSLEDQLTDGILTEPLVDVIAEQEETVIPEIDILSTNTHFAQTIRRIRNATWAIRIKKKYNNICAVPNCDVTGLIFVEAAHIKPDNAPEEAIPHRAHILNGLCLCKNCHIAFDKGYFSLTDDHKIITSSKFDQIPDQNLKIVITSSMNKKIKKRIDNRLPLVEFIQYHRANYFRI